MKGTVWAAVLLGLVMGLHAEEGGAFKKLDPTKEQPKKTVPQLPEGTIKLGRSDYFKIKLIAPAEVYTTPGGPAYPSMGAGVTVEVHAIDGDWLYVGLEGLVGRDFWIKKDKCEPLPEKVQQVLNPSVSSDAEIAQAIKEKKAIVGMTREQLIKALGKPKGKSLDGDNEVLIFEKWKTVKEAMESNPDKDGKTSSVQFTRPKRIASYLVTMRNDVAIKVQESRD